MTYAQILKIVTQCIVDFISLWFKFLWGNTKVDICIFRHSLLYNAAEFWNYYTLKFCFIKYWCISDMQFCVCLSYSIMISVEEYKQLSVLMTGVCKQRQKSRQREGLYDKSILMRFLFRLALFDIHRSCDQQLIAEWASCRSAPLLVSSQAERPAWLHKFLKKNFL